MYAYASLLLVASAGAAASQRDEEPDLVERVELNRFLTLNRTEARVYLIYGGIAVPAYRPSEPPSWFGLATEARGPLGLAGSASLQAGRVSIGDYYSDQYFQDAGVEPTEQELRQSWAESAWGGRLSWEPVRPSPSGHGPTLRGGLLATGHIIGGGRDDVTMDLVGQKEYFAGGTWVGPEFGLGYSFEVFDWRFEPNIAWAWQNPAAAQKTDPRLEGDTRDVALIELYQAWFYSDFDWTDPLNPAVLRTMSMCAWSGRIAAFVSHTRRSYSASRFDKQFSSVTLPPDSANSVTIGVGLAL